MERNIVLLRAINVGGNNKLPMAKLRARFEEMGAQNTKTYIQSGNVVFDGSLSKEDIELAIETEFGFHSDCFLFTKARFANIADECPYEDEGNKVHIYFCQTACDFDDEKAHALALPSEAFVFCGAWLYLHAPDGLARSKLAAGLPKCFSAPVTARNMNTVKKLITL